MEVPPCRRNGALGPMQSIYLRDPDGNLVEISSYVEDSCGAEAASEDTAV